MINAFVRRVVLLLFLVGCALNAGVASELPITVWKSPTCGCCQAWVDYLEDNGFSVTAHDVDETAFQRIVGRLQIQYFTTQADQGDPLIQGQIGFGT